MWPDAFWPESYWTAAVWPREESAAVTEGAGYWPRSYFAASVWPDAFWPDGDAVAVVFITLHLDVTAAPPLELAVTAAAPLHLTITAAPQE